MFAHASGTKRWRRRSLILFHAALFIFSLRTHHPTKLKVNSNLGKIRSALRPSGQRATERRNVAQSYASRFGILGSQGKPRHRRVQFFRSIGLPAFHGKLETRCTNNTRVTRYGRLRNSLISTKTERDIVLVCVYVLGDRSRSNSDGAGRSTNSPEETRRERAVSQVFPRLRIFLCSCNGRLPAVAISVDAEMKITSVVSACRRYRL